MTTRGVQDPIAIHFLIDGQHGILEARDIAASMHFPPIPEDLGSFRHWSQYSEPDIVSALSGGRVTGRTILRRELSPRMLLIDLVLRTNLFPLQHVVQRRGAILDALYRISEGFYFGPHHLVMAALSYFEEKRIWDTLLTSPRASSSLSRQGPTYHRAFFLTAQVTCTHDTPAPPVLLLRPMPIRALMSSFHSLSASRATLVREMQAIDADGYHLRHIGLKAYSYPGPALAMLSRIHHHRAYHLLHLGSHIHDWIFLSPFCLCFL
ncbi:hypothetical protein AAG906_006070 [Vitis piasezkii]